MKPQTLFLNPELCTQVTMLLMPYEKAELIGNEGVDDDDLYEVRQVIKAPKTPKPENPGMWQSTMTIFFEEILPETLTLTPKP